MPRIFDNIDEHLGTSLRKSLASSNALDACVGYFNLRGWSQLCTAVEALPADDAGDDRPPVRLLVGMQERPDVELRRALRIGSEPQPMDQATALELAVRAAEEFAEQLTIGVPTAQDERTLRRLREQLADGRVQVKLHLQHRLHAKLYLCHREDYDNPRVGYVGSSNLTFSGLLHQGELNVDVLPHEDTEKLAKWFQHRWEDRFSIDITDELIQIIDESWASEELLSPYLIYLKVAYHLSRDAREGLIEFGLPASMSQKLLDFQAAAVRVAARHLTRRGGVMIGDVVGLGKTLVATALALLMQEEEGTEALIICPKNLVAMWQGYVDEYRLHAKVLSLSMVTRELEDLRRYRIVIVDESHNLRNVKRQDYGAIKDYISKNDSRVILLTATPYNKRFEDVAAQLGLFLSEDENLGIRPERAIKELGTYKFMQRCDGKPSTLGAFRVSEHVEDWQRLMSLFLLRRTRRFIRDNYAHEDADGRQYLTFADGKRFYFPDRVARTLAHDLEDEDPAAAMITDDVLDTINELHLPRYTLGEYINEAAAPTEAETRILSDLERAGGNLQGFTRTMLFKRLSSCGDVFILSLQRHLLRNLRYLHAIETGNDLPLGTAGDPWNDDTDEPEAELGSDIQSDEAETPEPRDLSTWKEIAEREYRELVARGSRQVRWINSGLFTDKLTERLRQDCDAIHGLLQSFGVWDPDADTKLDSLVRLLTETHADRKVLIFTEYRDTAEYVGNHLRERGIDKLGVVTGTTNDPTSMAVRFSPNSNREIKPDVPKSDELRVLVATDVLSEGQNLQDAAIVVNYDLPWAIIKIIQRAGRVDRVGQESDEVLVYSFLPNDDVENVIRLQGRIAERLEESAKVFGSDERFFNTEQERERVLRGLYTEHSEIEDPIEASEEVDASSTAYEIWRQATEEHPELAKRAETLPDVVHATRRSGDHDGVMLFTRTRLGFDSLAMIQADGSTRTLSPVETLATVACDPDEEPLEHRADHHELVQQAAEGPLRAPEIHAEGMLTGIRKRVYNRLRTHRDHTRDTLFELEGLEDALGAIYERPLREQATRLLAKALRERTNDDVAALIVQLHEQDRLCLELDDEDDELRIVCSMGFATAGETTDG